MPFVVPQFQGQNTVSMPRVNLAQTGEIVIRPARVGDVHGVSTLINHYAASNVMLPKGPQYLYMHIQDYMVMTAKDTEDQECVIACGSLHVLWSDLAEIRSMAVHNECQRQGLGRKLVSALIERCRALDIPRVFVFTLTPHFFASCGFRECNRDTLPAVVWAECSKCPKFYHCDETSMMYDL